MVMQVSPISTIRDRNPVSAVTTPPASSSIHSPAPAVAPPPASPPLSSPLSNPSGNGVPQSSPLQASDLKKAIPEPYNYRAHVTGAVLFESSGLPQEYFTTAQLSLENWEQLIFQLLGLRWLLMSSLRFDSFRFARASSGHHTAILLRQRENYVALLTENLQDKIYELEFRQWLSSFDLIALRHDERFQSF